MKTAIGEVYPGALSSWREALALADVYRLAAQSVHGIGRPGRPITRAPYRLVAIHAIELYLTALLLRFGSDPARLRGLQHDVAARGELAVDCGLTLRRRTRDHLKSLAETREYLVSRYAPGAAAGLSPPNRLSATLDEIAAKVSALVVAPER
jgi:hypothetical protein